MTAGAGCMAGPGPHAQPLLLIRFWDQTVYRVLTGQIASRFLIPVLGGMKEDRGSGVGAYTHRLILGRQVEVWYAEAGWARLPRRLEAPRNDM